MDKLFIQTLLFLFPVILLSQETIYYEGNKLYINSSGKTFNEEVWYANEKGGIIMNFIPNGDLTIYEFKTKEKQTLRYEFLTGHLLESVHVQYKPLVDREYNHYFLKVDKDYSITLLQNDTLTLIPLYKQTFMELYKVDKETAYEISSGKKLPKATDQKQVDHITQIEFLSNILVKHGQWIGDNNLNVNFYENNQYEGFFPGMPYKVSGNYEVEIKNMGGADRVLLFFFFDDGEKFIGYYLAPEYMGVENDFVKLGFFDIKNDMTFKVKSVKSISEVNDSFDWFSLLSDQVKKSRFLQAVSIEILGAIIASALAQPNYESAVEIYEEGINKLNDISVETKKSMDAFALDIIARKLGRK